MRVACNGTLEEQQIHDKRLMYGPMKIEDLMGSCSLYLMKPTCDCAKTRSIHLHPPTQAHTQQTDTQTNRHRDRQTYWHIHTHTHTHIHTHIYTRRNRARGRSHIHSFLLSNAVPQIVHRRCQQCIEVRPGKNDIYTNLIIDDIIYNIVCADSFQ
jgi:hypothetical protein